MASKRRSVRRRDDTTDSPAINQPITSKSFDFIDTEPATEGSRPKASALSSAPGASARAKRLARALGAPNTTMQQPETPVEKPTRKRLAAELDASALQTPPPAKRNRGRPRKNAAVVVVSGTHGPCTPAKAASTSSKRRGRPPKSASTPAKGGSTPAKAKAADTPSQGGKREKDAPQEEVSMRTQSYFDAHRAGAHRTSNCTLADLRLASAETLLEALRATPDLLADERAAEARKACSERRIRQLMFQLHAGCSLLYYGLGSKRVALRALAESLAEHYDVIEVCGFNPGLSARALFGRLVDDVLRIHAPFPRRSLSDYATAVRDFIGNRTIAVILHNIDGPSLRAPEAQRALAALSAVPGVLLAASVDHANAPLLWDGASWATFAWAWVNVNTFAFYDAETIFASKSMLHGARERRVEGAVMLLRSLSANARKVFAQLAQNQLGPEDQMEAGSKNAAPIARTTFNSLFDGCRRAFICTDTASLRSILTELETHDMLERRRGADAEEQIWIPLTVEQLKNVLSQIEK